MPNTPKVDKQQPKKSKEEAETPLIPEKKGKKSKTPKEEAQRAEEEKSSSKKKEGISSEKKERRKKTADGGGSALESDGLAQGLKESSIAAKKGKKPEKTTSEPPKTTPGPVKRKSAAETSESASDPLRYSKPVGTHETDAPRQKKRSRGDDKSMASMTTIAKRLKLNDGEAAAASSSKVKERSTKGGKYSSKEEEEIMLEDSSDGEVVGEDHIHGFSTDGDSSDDDMAADEVPPLDVSQLPTVAKDDATVQKRLQRAKSKPTVDRGVLYIGRIPHGFYEDQMKEYFSQFGNVTRLRMARNKKTGRSKHYGFIEFDSSSVAQIVSETMDNYLIMGHLLQCKIVPMDKVHPDLWVGANRRWRKVPVNRVARVSHNKPRTEEQRARAEKKLLRRQEGRMKRLKDNGIEYSFGTAAYTPVGA